MSTSTERLGMIPETSSVEDAPAKLTHSILTRKEKKRLKRLSETLKVVAEFWCVFFTGRCGDPDDFFEEEEDGTPTERTLADFVRTFSVQDVTVEEQEYLPSRIEETFNFLTAFDDRTLANINAKDWERYGALKEMIDGSEKELRAAVSMYG